MGNIVEVHDKGEEVQPRPGGEKIAGRFALTCTIAAGRQGRAFVKPFYAQANAPLHGFDMSPALLNAALWWTKFLELKPSVRLAVGHTTRETVWAWTDASGENPWLGVAVYARDSWYCTHLDAPPAVFDQLLHRQDSQINFLEMLAVLLFVTTFQDILCSTAAFVFIDNNGVLPAHQKRTCSGEESGCMQRSGRGPQFGRGLSQLLMLLMARPATIFTHVESLGAELVALALPQWLSTLWILDCGDCP